MVFRGTITNEWNGRRQPLETMVFQWFLGQATIGNDGFRWLFTIGPTMEWLSTIVQVHDHVSSGNDSSSTFQIKKYLIQELPFVHPFDIVEHWLQHDQAVAALAAGIWNSIDSVSFSTSLVKYIL